MEKVFRIGQMEQNIKECGVTIRQMEEEFYGILMAIDFKANF